MQIRDKDKRQAAARRIRARKPSGNAGRLLCCVGLLQQVRVSLLHQSLTSDVLRSWNEENDRALGEVVATLNELLVELVKADGEGGANRG